MDPLGILSALLGANLALTGLLFFALRRRRRRAGKALDEILERLCTMGDRVGALEEATGGLWRTARGELMQIRDMSDGHLAACHRDGCGPATMKKLENEIERRRIDRAKEAAREKAQADLKRLPRRKAK